MARCLADSPAAGGANGTCAPAASAAGGSAAPPAAVLVDVLLIVSQLARLHKDSFNTYEPLAKANIYANIRRWAGFAKRYGTLCECATQQRLRILREDTAHAGDSGPSSSWGGWTAAGRRRVGYGRLD